MPELLRQHSYHTACIGKWHLGFTIEGADKSGGGKGKRAGAPLGAVTPDGPVTRGFDEFFGFHHARMMKSLFENDRVTKMIEPLDKTGASDDTLVIFTSDNGCSPAAGTTQLEAQGHFASAQFRGYKSDIWDGGHRVPFWCNSMIWPTTSLKPRTCRRLIPK